MDTVSQREQQQIPRLQRLFENIWFLLTLGVLLPTIVYTAWSVYDLVELPYFPLQTAEQLQEQGTTAAADTHGLGTSATASAPQPAPVAGVTVSMKDLAYHPQRLVVAAGTTVTWVNDDPFVHAVASGRPDTREENRLFASSGDFAPGKTFSFTFDNPGEYQIYCSTPGHFAAGMTMTVVVEEGT